MKTAADISQTSILHSATFNASTKTCRFFDRDSLTRTMYKHKNAQPPKTGLRGGESNFVSNHLG